MSTWGCSPQDRDIKKRLPAQPSISVESADNDTLAARKRGGEFTRATDKLGPLIVQEGRYSRKTEKVPWPASWYPKSEDYLFKGDSAPLRKYDLYTKNAHALTTHAAEFEQKHFYRPGEVPSAGRCDSWAIASILSPAPFIKQPIELNGVLFSTGDLKALTVLSYGDVEGIVQYGQRFNGDYRSIPDDIYPDQFHRILQSELFGKGRPFIVDRDSSVEVWSTPIYEAELLMVRDPENTHIMHVHSTLKGMNPSGLEMSPDNTEPQEVLLEYTYDLYGQPLLQGGLSVVAGEWTGASVKIHPDFAWTLPETVNRRSLNSEIDFNIVDEIVHRALHNSFTLLLQ
jgi:hypothetical protein